MYDIGMHVALANNIPQKIDVHHRLDKAKEQTRMFEDNKLLVFSAGTGTIIQTASGKCQTESQSYVSHPADKKLPSWQI